MKLIFSLALPLYFLDQITKAWVVAHLVLHEQRAVVRDFFDIVYFANTGAAFSSFSGNNGFFIALSLVTLVALLFFTVKGAFPDRISRIGVGLLLAGILGNVSDRIVHGHVVDFLLFDLHVPYANPWPAFNVADSCICVAAALFVCSGFLTRKNTTTTREKN